MPDAAEQPVVEDTTQNDEIEADDDYGMDWEQETLDAMEVIEIENNGGTVEDEEETPPAEPASTPEPEEESPPSTPTSADVGAEEPSSQISGDEQEQEAPPTDETATPPVEEETEPQPEFVEQEAPVSTVDPTEARNNYFAQLESQYAIDDESAELLSSDPKKVVPRALAMVQLQTEEAIMRRMGELIPSTVTQIIKQQESASADSNAFLGMFPSLKGQDALVSQLIQNYGKQFPGATKATAMKAVGLQACAALGQDLREVYTNMDLALSGNQAPATPAEPAPQRVVPPSPAQPGKVAPAPTTRQEKDNVWTEMLNPNIG